MQLVEQQCAGNHITQRCGEIKDDKGAKRQWTTRHKPGVYEGIEPHCWREAQPKDQQKHDIQRRWWIPDLHFGCQFKL